MFQRFLIILILMSVEFSTVKVYFDDFKENIELNDSENTNENEEPSK